MRRVFAIIPGLILGAAVNCRYDVPDESDIPLAYALLSFADICNQDASAAASSINSGQFLAELRAQANEGNSGPPSADVTTITGLPVGNKWASSILSFNKKLYSIPVDSGVVLITDPATNSTDITSITGLGVATDKWFGGVLAMNGKIYGIPFSDTRVLVIDPTTNTET